MSSERSRRLFFALPLPEQLRQQLADWRDQLPIQGKPSKPSNFHQTLVFLGQVEERYLQALCELGQQQQSEGFELSYDRFGAWFKPGVFFVAPSEQPDALLQLVDNLRVGAKALGLEVESRRYKPHITLFRKVRKLPDLDSEMPAMQMYADCFALYQSCSTKQGVEYRALQSWPLGAAS